MKKTALVTGGSAGIGKECVQALVARGYDVLVVARDAVKGQSLIQELRAQHPQAEVDFMSVDLSDFSAVEALAVAVRQRWSTLDALVLNAGLFTPRLSTNAAGYELMFATTHLAHFLLTHHLLPLLQAGARGRIVVTSSVAHFFAGRFAFDALTLPSSRSFLLLAPFRAYGQSKLANLLFVRELARRLGPNSAVRVNAFHPGAVKSEIWRGTPRLFNALIAPTLISPAEGARTQIMLATAPDLKTTGAYWARDSVRYSSAASRDAKAAARLWALSESVLGITDFGRPVAR